MVLMWLGIIVYTLCGAVVFKALEEDDFDFAALDAAATASAAFENAAADLRLRMSGSFVWEDQPLTQGALANLTSAEALNRMVLSTGCPPPRSDSWDIISGSMFSLSLISTIG
jgi:hypothetical protein